MTLRAALFDVGDTLVEHWAPADVLVSSHDAGWRKPHPAMFERALEIAEARPAEAFHVGDDLIADVWGAQHAGLRAVWRRADYADALTRAAEEAGSVATAGGPTGWNPWMDREPRDPTTCEHPSEDLFLRDGRVMCGACGGPAGIDVRPHAVVRDLTELPRVLEGWLA